MAETFDVAIVGARCAGSPLAMMLASRGLRVCLLDRCRFPSDTLSTHVIQPCGVAILGKLGVLDAVMQAGAAALTRFTLLAEDARIDAEASVGALGGAGLCIRRATLDHLLVEAARSSGAQVLTGTGVTGLLHEHGRVAGVETPQGSIRAALVVGADGRRSTIARLVGAGEYHVAPPGRLFSWAYFEGEPRLRLGRLGDLAFLASPTDGGLYLAGVCPRISDKEAFLKDRERRFMAGVRGWPELSDLLAGARRSGPIRVVGNCHGYFRQAAGAGWALVGDAGTFKDPTPAQGMADALRHAERLADVIDQGLGGACSVGDALKRWWRWRDEDAYEMHWFAADIGAGAAPVLGTQMIREIAADERATGDILGVLNHQIAPSEVLGARRMGMAVMRAARDKPARIPAIASELRGVLRNQVRRRRARSKLLAGPHTAR